MKKCPVYGQLFSISDEFFKAGHLEGIAKL